MAAAGGCFLKPDQVAVPDRCSPLGVRITGAVRHSALPICRVTFFRRSSPAVTKAGSSYADEPAGRRQ